MSNTFPSFKIVQRDYTRKDGSKNLFLRLTIKRKTRYFPLDIFVRPKNFNPKTEKISRSEPGEYDKSLLLDHYSLKAKNILHEYKLNDKVATFRLFIQDFNNTIYGNKSFYVFFDGQIELLKYKMSPGTIRDYKSQINKLKEYRPELSFNDINIDLIEAFERYIVMEKENSKNTVRKTMKVIKTFLNRAVDQGIIKENPFKLYKLEAIIGNRKYLTIAELALIEGLYSKQKLTPSEQNVLRYFLFSCYTGLRYQDIKELRFKDIIDNKTISIQMGKTKKFVEIPLIRKAKALIPSRGFDKQNVFRVLTGQPTNRYLKTIMKTAGINKTISFHCARHTFATVSKSYGVPYDVISNILGHTDIKTTKIYVKYELDYKAKEMGKMDK